MPRAIVYSARSKIPRRIIVADHISELQDGSHVGPGEAILIVKDDMPVNHLAARHHVAAHHGIDHESIPTGRCAIVANGQVVDVVMADPDIDTHPLGKLVAHESAAIGDTLGDD